MSLDQASCHCNSSFCQKTTFLLLNLNSCHWIVDLSIGPIECCMIQWHGVNGPMARMKLDSILHFCPNSSSIQVSIILYDSIYGINTFLWKGPLTLPEETPFDAILTLSSFIFTYFTLVNIFLCIMLLGLTERG